MEHRNLILAGVAATMLAAGPAFAAGETAQETQATGQQAEATAAEQGAQIGEGTLPMPEWEYYDELDPKYGPLAWLTFGEVVGADVVSQEGETVGEIIGLVRDRAEEEFFAVVAPAAGDNVVVPIDHFEVGQDKQIVFAAPETMESMRAYDESEFEVTTPEAQQQ